MSWLLPSWLRVRWGRWPGLWLPIFLLWPLWWLLLLTAFVLACALSAPAGRGGIARVFDAARGLHTLLCSTRGARCEIRGRGRLIEVAVI